MNLYLGKRQEMVMHTRLNANVVKRHTCSNPVSPLSGFCPCVSAPSGDGGRGPWHERFRAGCSSALGDVGDLVHERRVEDEGDLFLLLHRWCAFELSRCLNVGRAVRTAVKRAMNPYKS